MNIVFINRVTFTSENFTDVSNIAYEKTTNIYTITYGNAQTTTRSGDVWLLTILF